LQEKLGVISKDVFKAGNSLAGGVARQGETCGAVTGAIMAIGSVSGRETFEDTESYTKAMDLAVLFHKRFKEVVGQTLCWEIHKVRYGKVFRLFNPEERDAFKHINAESSKGCPDVIGTAARIVAEIILDDIEKELPCSQRR
jgi:C_GCAxxG_C_C family probable redox protein